MSLRPLLDIAADNERVHALAGRARDAAAGGRSSPFAPRRCCGLCCWRRCSRTTAGWPAVPPSWSAPTIAPLATSPPTCAPIWRRVVSASTPRAVPATPPTSPRRRTWSGCGSTPWTALRNEEDAVVVAGATALAEAVPDASLRPAGFAIAKGEEIDLGDVAKSLVAAGYERVEQVEERGQFAVRGGILDVFPATEERAVRIELFGDEVESMRWFSTFTQRSLGDGRAGRAGPGRRARRRAPRAGRAGGDGGRREGRGAAEPRRRAAAARTSARRSTSSPTPPR